jgi:hypothetical protein
MDPQPRCAIVVVLRLVEHTEETVLKVFAAAGDHDDRSVDAAWFLATRT